MGRKIKQIHYCLQCLLKSEIGADAVEYAGLVAVIAVLLASVAQAISRNGQIIGDALSQVLATWISQLAG